MAKCAICEKGAHFGNNVSHSHRRSNKMWKSNVKSVKVKTANGGAKKMYVCTSCLRSGKWKERKKNRYAGIFLHTFFFSRIILFIHFICRINDIRTEGSILPRSRSQYCLRSTVRSPYQSLYKKA